MSEYFCTDLPLSALSLRGLEGLPSQKCMSRYNSRLLFTEVLDLRVDR
jgi:hypothetical protein